jgi:hypothetical protein
MLNILPRDYKKSNESFIHARVRNHRVGVWHKGISTIDQKRNKPMLLNAFDQNNSIYFFGFVFKSGKKGGENAFASKSRRDIHISQIQTWHERPPVDLMDFRT